MQAQKILEMLGYSAKEAKVYLMMLSLGECHLSDIADKVKLPRSSTQVIMDKLYKDGLVNFYVMRRYKYWVAENPEHLLEMLKHREQAVESVMPSLVAIRKARQGRRHVHRTETSSAFRLLADTIRQPVLITNDRAEIEYVNRAWEEEFGYLLEDIAGENPRILKSGRTTESVYAEAWEHLKKGKMFQTDKMVDRRKNGTSVRLMTTMFPMEIGGKVRYVQILNAMP